MEEDKKEQEPKGEEQQEDLEASAEEKETKEDLKKELKEEEPAKEEAEAEEEEAPEPEEEAKPSEREEKKKKEEEIVEERTYTVPLGKAWIMPSNKRAARAMRMLKKFVTKHMKLEAPKEGETEEEEEPGKLIIDNDVNRKIWSRGIGKPPRKIRVRAAKDKDGNVTVYLAEGD